MKYLKSFILGIATILLFIPIAESLCEVICTGMEYLKGIISVPILKLNKQIQELQLDQEEVSTSCMGFEYYEPEELYEDDDFEDKKNESIKFGFH